MSFPALMVTLAFIMIAMEAFVFLCGVSIYYAWKTHRGAGVLALLCLMGAYAVRGKLAEAVAWIIFIGVFAIPLAVLKLLFKKEGSDGGDEKAGRGSAELSA